MGAVGERLPADGLVIALGAVGEPVDPPTGWDNPGVAGARFPVAAAAVRPGAVGARLPLVAAETSPGAVGARLPLVDGVMAAASGMVEKRMSAGGPCRRRVMDQAAAGMLKALSADLSCQIRRAGSWVALVAAGGSPRMWMWDHAS